VSDKVYLDVLRHILNNGVSDKGHREVRAVYRDGEKAYAISSPTPIMMQFDASKGEFPYTTVRPLAWKSALKEIDWIYRDKSNSVDLLEKKHGVYWWRAWARDDGTIGDSYGWQIANRKRYIDGHHLDQMDWLLHKLRHSPDRRMIMSMFEPEGEQFKQLQECAYETIWQVVGNKLNMTLIQRSSDFVVAGMINSFQYYCLMLQVAHATGYEAGIFTHFIQDAHIYERHLHIVEELLSREPKPTPVLHFDKEGTNFYKLDNKQFFLEYIYKPHPQVHLEIAE
jgi:thymidylate synthase